MEFLTWHDYMSWRDEKDALASASRKDEHGGIDEYLVILLMFVVAIVALALLLPRYKAPEPTPSQLQKNIVALEQRCEARGAHASFSIDAHGSLTAVCDVKS